MRNNSIINCVAGIVSIGAIAAMHFSSSGGFSPHVQSDLHEAVADVMAREALSLLKPGGQVIAIARDTSTFPSPATDCMVAELTKKLRQARAPLSQLRRLQVDPLRIVEVPGGDFFDLIRKTPEGSVIVSLMGPPILNDAQIRQLPVSGPGVVALCSPTTSGRVDLRKLFEQKIVQSAILPRPDAEASKYMPSTPQARFDKFYLDVTAANVDSALPVPSGRSTTQPKT